MEIFLDTASVDVIEKYAFLIDGVTTNPSIISRCADVEYIDLIKKICESVNGHVSVEVISDSYDQMLEEGKNLSKLADNMCIKLPCTADGFKVCKQLSKIGIATNMTLCFSPTQAIIAAKSGATYISAFVGRMDDIGNSGINLVEEIINIYDSCDFDTKILAASIRNIDHIVRVAKLGVDVITIFPSLLEQCFNHPLTNIGMEMFAKDWANKKVIC